jgi:hypothetical protein
MTTALLVMTNGRDELLTQTIASFFERTVRNDVSFVLIHDDSGDQEHFKKMVALVDTDLIPVNSVHVHTTGSPLGFGGAIRNAWSLLAEGSRRLCRTRGRMGRDPAQLDHEPFPFPCGASCRWLARGPLQRGQVRLRPEGARPPMGCRGQRGAVRDLGTYRGSTARAPHRGLSHWLWLLMHEMQQRATEWHMKRFSQAQPLGIFAKAVEELGEVATAIIFDVSTNAGATGKLGDVAAESAEVAAKLDLLLTPGAHKSGLPA